MSALRFPCGKFSKLISLAVALFGFALASAIGQPDKKDHVEREVAPPPREKQGSLDLSELVGKPINEALPIVRLYDADRGALLRTYAVPTSATRAARLKKFHTDWLHALKAFNSTDLSPAAREELVGLRSRVETELKEVENRAAEAAAIAPLIPFAEPIVEMEETRRRMEPLDPQAAGSRLDMLRKQIEKQRAGFEASLKTGEKPSTPPATKPEAIRAADATDSMRQTLKTWHGFYTGYDPLFIWWAAEPYKQTDTALESYAKFLRDKAKELPEGDKKAVTPSIAIAPTPGLSDVPILQC